MRVWVQVSSRSKKQASLSKVLVLILTLNITVSLWMLKQVNGQTFQHPCYHTVSLKIWFQLLRAPIRQLTYEIWNPQIKHQTLNIYFKIEN